MAPSTRIIMAVLGSTILGIALCLALIFGSLDRLRLQTAEANVDFMLTQLRDSIEANAGLGLPLADMRISQDLIERAKANDDDVLAVELFSPDGVSLFNTDRGSIGERVPSLWQDAVRYRIENERWRIQELGNIVVGEVLRNDFDEPIGYVAVTISGEARREHAQAVMFGLLETVSIVTPLVLAIVLVASILLLSRLQKDFRTLSQALSSEAGAKVQGHDALSSRAGPLRKSVERTVSDLEQAASEVLAVDEAEGGHV